MLTIRHPQPDQADWFVLYRARSRATEKQGYTLKEDAGRGYRRVVACQNRLISLKKKRLKLW